MPESDIPHRGGHAAHEKRHRHKQHRVGPDLIRKDLKFDCPTGEYVESFSRKDRFGKSEKMYRLVSDNERASFKLGKRYPGAAIDAFDLASTDVLYSMNKKERWEIPERLQERIVDYQNEELGLRVCGYEMRYNPSKPIATDTNRIHVDTLAQFSGTFHAVTVAAHEMDEEGSEKHRYRARANVLDFQQKPNPPRLNGGKRRKIHRAAELEGLLSETESEDEKDKENKTPLVTASYACVISYRGNNVLDNTIAKSNSHTQRNRVSGRSRRRVGLDDVILDLSLDTMPLDEDIDCTSDRCKEMIASLEDFAVVKCRQPKQKKNANKVAKTSELEDKPRRLVYIPSENPAKTDLSVNYRASLTQYVLEHPRRISGILRKGVTFSIPPVLPPRLIVRDNFGKIDRRLHNFEGVLQIPFKDIDERLPTVYMQRPSASWNGMILSNKQLRDLAIDMATTSKDIETTECSICGEEVKDGFALSECSHFFCMRCWQMHAVISLRSCVAPISCMDTSCKAFVCRETLALFLSPAGLDRYDELLKLQAERAAYKGLQCSCKRILKAELAVGGHVECKCGVHTCVRCHKVHFPMSCAEHVVYQRSLKKLGIGAPSEHPHLSLELVVCPRCALPLDRSYGCNHIVCLCGKEFCFVCGGGWSGTHYHCTQKNRKTFIMIDIPRHMREAPRRALITALNFREATTNADKTVWRSRHLDAQGRQMYRVHMRKVRRIFEFSYALLYVRVVNDQRVTGLEYWLQRAAFDYEMLQHHVEVATSSTRKLAVREAIVESNESLKTLAEFCSRLRPLVV